MKILLLLLVFLLCKEGKGSVFEQSAGSGDFSDIEEDENKTETQSITSDDEYDVYYVSDIEEDENKTETQSITSDDEYDVYYVNRLFFYQVPHPFLF